VASIMTLSMSASLAKCSNIYKQCSNRHILWEGVSIVHHCGSSRGWR
jgi:hypothetical protein